MIPATIGQNVLTNSCNPASGFVVAFTLTGPVFVDNGHCQVQTHLDGDLNPPSPAILQLVPPTFDVSGRTTITLQTIAVSFQGFIGDAGF